MRLDRFNPANISVRNRGGGGGFPGGGGGKLGCGTIVIALIAALVFGIDPGQMLGTMEGMQQGAPAQQREVQGQSTTEICEQNQYSLESCNALSSLNETWEPLFAQANIAFRQPTLNFYQGGTRSGCGAAAASMGPFYCPADEGIYIDTSFYDQLANQLGARGDFARYYVMAHEYGHHVQHVTGLAGQVRSAQQQNPRGANQLQVRMELQADCYAGVWAGRNRNLIEQGDMEEGLRAASAIGDDALQSGSGRAVNPESFTHGSSQQRMEWLERGLRTGNDEACDTFADMRR
ncbi:KPN_02809 family neutral zinc metallopeptidase [Novosphingobium marinum]|uniref:KPN_02809 family neutral zinc metallopeptidase n=1 Tax=Novosphingobium marinum TaxID=1514948 RepID=UPI0015CB861A|nr:neutral zinc metallopeptidase [Novosphingobium marinum]